MNETMDQLMNETIVINDERINDRVSKLELTTLCHLIMARGLFYRQLLLRLSQSDRVYLAKKQKFSDLYSALSVYCQNKDRLICLLGK